MKTLNNRISMLTVLAIPAMFLASTKFAVALVNESPLTPFVSIQSNNFPTNYIRHRNLLGEISPVVSDLDRTDASFQITNGLASSNCVSFESTNFPNHYLRHQDFRIKLQKRDGTALFNSDATFCIKPGLGDKSSISFRSYNFPNRYIRHRNFALYIDPYSSNAVFLNDATFTIVQPFFKP